MSVKEIQIRPITLDDVEGFHACLDAVSREREYLGFVAAPPIEDTREWLTKAAARNEIRLVAEDGSEIIGWCDIAISTLEGFAHAGRVGMGVLRRYRGRGIGSSLLERCLEEAEARGLERIELDVFASNETAIRLYEKYGFQLEGRKRKARKIEREYDDMIVMALFFG